jgi:nucleoside-diphosphate-sugar epimerase
MNTPADSALPAAIGTEADLDDLLTRPGAALTRFIKTLTSPLVILGAGGKMGPTLAVLARRAAEAAGHPLEVIAVSRFTDERARAWLEERGVATRSCDLLNADAVRTLPDAENLIYLVGLKFGTGKNPAMTWAMNVLVPARVAERYPTARITALSTGNVYPLSAVSGVGSLETDALTPLGEYANAAVGRERIFEFYSRRDGLRLTVLRLFYAVELRYGVLVDIARKVFNSEPISLANGSFNCIWQGDANDMILRSLALAASPPTILNLCRPEIFSVRAVATRLGELLGRAPLFEGQESPTALIANAARAGAELGEPPTALETMLRWIAHWVARDGRNLGRPTHFEVRDGKY